jgi:glycine hydroxymethyltransferase
MDQVRELARMHRPKLIIVGASSYPRALNFQDFRTIADEVGAYLMADVAHIAGLIIAGHHNNPLPHAHVVTSTTHKTLRGPRGGIVLTNDADLARRIDLAVFPGLQGGPLMHVIAAKGICFQEAAQPSFRSYISMVCANAKALAMAMHQKGYKLLSGGTDNHLMVIDFGKDGISGQVAQKALEEIFITTNKNGVPNDSRPPMHTSGLRLGTPAVTTRGFQVEDMAAIAFWIDERLKNPNGSVENLKKDIRDLCEKYPLGHFVALGGSGSRGQGDAMPLAMVPMTQTLG